jgi:thiol-disulfide isomerase/thioredoxin
VIAVAGIFGLVGLAGMGTGAPVAGAAGLSPATASSSTAANAAGAFPLPPGVLAKVTGLPLRDLVSAAEDKSLHVLRPQALPASSRLFKSAGKPYILYMGAEYCPYCAAERWPLVMALAKFGTFSNLRRVASSADDVYPSTPTFSFYGSTYTSRFVSFAPVELNSNKVSPSSGSFAVLQYPTRLELRLFEQWDKAPYTSEAGGIPFVYIAGRYLVTGAQYDAGKISGWQMAAAATYMAAGNNPSSRAAEAAAGYLIADICSLTRDRPAPVCSVARRV